MSRHVLIRSARPRVARATSLYLALVTLAALALFEVAVATAQDAADSNAPPAVLHALSPDGTVLGSCPLEHTDVDLEVSGFVVRARVRHRFTNPFAERIEAVYAFPLPESAAVRDMEMRVGDRVVAAQIQRREEARQTYERARSEGRTTSLLEQERPNIFTASVANIRPGVPVEVTLEYVEVLQPDAGRWELAFPMTIGPRFIPGDPVAGRSGGGYAGDTTAVPDAARISPPVAPAGRSGHDISLAVHLDGGAQLGDVSAPGHDINLTRLSPERARIELAAHESIPNRDFVLRWTVDPSRVGATVLAHRPGPEADGSTRDGYLTVMLQSRQSPPLDEVTRREIVFVLDTSGSMYGQPMDLSKELMRSLIRDLRPEDTFGVLRYNDSSSALWPAPMPATPGHRSEALAFVDTLEGSGGTDALGGVRAAFAYPSDPSRLRIVVFLTDGYIGNDDDVIREVQTRIGDARLFGFGVGSSVNRYLLEEMGRVGRGATDIVTLHHDPHAQVRRFYERLRRPYLTDVSVDWGGLEVASAYPERIPDLFVGQPVLVHARYARPGAGTITVRGRLAGRPFSQAIEVSLPAHDEAHSAIASVWARERIGELERSMRLGETQALTDQLTDTALSHRLASRFTSFVAVEGRLVPAGEGGDPSHTVMVPVAMPEGVSPEHTLGSSLSLARFQPGDPELRVDAPADARAVVAVFPFAETRTLSFEPRLGMWTTRFLVPRGTAEGNYYIAIVVTTADGRQERMSQGYTVDGSAPDVEVSFEGELIPGTEVRVVARQRFTAADRRLHGRHRRVEIVSDVARLRLTTESGELIHLRMLEPGVWEGTYRVPSDGRSEARFTLAAFDVAGNRGTRIVRVEIAPDPSATAPGSTSETR